MPRISWTGVLSAVFISYVLNSVYTLYQLYVIPPCKDKNCIPSYLAHKSDFRLYFFSSPSGDVNAVHRMTEITVWDDFDLTVPIEKTLNVTVPKQVFKNGTAFIHVFLVPNTGSRLTLDQLVQKQDISFASGPLTSFAVPEVATFSLLGEKKDQTTHETQSERRDRPVSHWQSRIIVEVVTDFMDIPARGMPHELIRFIRVTPHRKYLPTLIVDKMSYRLKDLVLVNGESKEMQLQIIYSPISFGKLRLWVQLEAAMKTMSGLGFSSKDIDEVKGIFTDTSLYLLCTTFVVAAFHLLFDFLAFKNDIVFWKKKKTMVGMSSRTVIWRSISHTIVFLYLLDEQTSLLVLIPSGIGTLIEVWKVFRAFKISISWSKMIPKLNFGETSDDEKQTQEYDAQVMQYLSYLLYPLCFCGAVYSLIYMPHKSWYSWCVQSLVNGVYAFGFLFMFPQLFVNYKLKSVAHLPWKAFMYKAFNTFIDDVFAFIITMPTAHRVACFRDDIVFLIYLYQRWLYPVDKSRVNEFGESYEDELNSKEVSPETNIKKRN